MIVATFCPLAVCFVIFVCYEMHRLKDLSPVAYIGPSIVGPLATVLGFYMWRANAKDKSDLEWEKTKKLTQLKTKHPASFSQSYVALSDTDVYTDTENGGNG